MKINNNFKQLILKQFKQRLNTFLDGFSEENIILISNKLQIFGGYKTIKSRKQALLKHFNIDNENDYKSVCQLIWKIIRKDVERKEKK